MSELGEGCTWVGVGEWGEWGEWGGVGGMMEGSGGECGGMERSAENGGNGGEWGEWGGSGGEWRGVSRMGGMEGSEEIIQTEFWISTISKIDNNECILIIPLTDTHRTSVTDSSSSHI